MRSKATPQGEYIGFDRNRSSRIYPDGNSGYSERPQGEKVRLIGPTISGLVSEYDIALATSSGLVSSTTDLVDSLKEGEAMWFFRFPISKYN